MSAMQRGWIVLLCLALGLPAEAQQRFQLAPLGFTLEGVTGDLPRPSRAQWRTALSTMFPPPAGADQRSLQHDMLVHGHGRRQDVAGALDPHGLTEEPPGQGRSDDLEWKPPQGGDQYLSIVPLSTAVSLDAMARMAAAALNSPCGPLPVVRLGRLLPARPDMPTFAVECRGHAPTPGGGIAETGAVSAVAAIAGGLALTYAAHGPQAGARHIDRFQALIATIRPGSAGGRQALRADDHASATRRFGQALSLPEIAPEQWERAGSMNTRLCDGKWGEIPRAVTCLRIFPAGETPSVLLARHLQVDAWECGIKIVQRNADADQAGAQVRCDKADRVGGLATRVYVIRRDPADGRLVFATTYGKAEDSALLAMSDTASRAIARVLSQR